MVTIFIFHEVSFLSLVRRSLRSFHLPQCAHFFDMSFPHLHSFPITLPIFSACTSYFQTKSLFFSIYFSYVERRCPLRTAMTRIRPYRLILYDTITSFAVLLYFDSESAASRSFSFSRNSKMLSSR